MLGLCIQGINTACWSLWYSCTSYWLLDVTWHRSRSYTAQVTLVGYLVS